MRSLILIGLVVLSLTLSLRLWAGNTARRPLTTDLKRVGAVSERPGMDTLLAPRQIILHLGRDRHSRLSPGDPGYVKAWRWGSQRMAILNNEAVPAKPEGLDQELLERRSGPGLEMILPLSLLPEEWLEAWDGFKHGPTRPAVRRLFFSAEKPATVFLWSDEGLPPYRLTWPSGEQDLAAFLAELAQITGALPAFAELPRQIGGIEVSGGIYLPAGPILVPQIAGVSEPANLTRDPGREAGRFFLDLSVVRTVKERDGALIYTDGRQGLRVYPGGSLEYTAVPPSAGDFSTLWEALDQARDFIANHGGWPEQPGIDSAVPGNRGWRLKFSFLLGKLRAAGHYGPLEVTLRGLNVVEFRRSLAIPAGFPPGSIKEGALLRAIDPVEAVATVAQSWLTVFPGESPRPARSVELVYWIPHRLESPADIRPAWMVGFGDLTAYVDAANGRLLP